MTETAVRPRFETFRPPPRLDRSRETHLVALTVARLMLSQTVPLREARVDAYCGALGISRKLLDAAVLDITHHGWIWLSNKPAKASTEFGVQAPEPRPKTHPSHVKVITDRADAVRRSETKPIAGRKIAPYGPEKWCPQCQVTMPIDKFRAKQRGKLADGSIRWGLDTYCIPCRNAFQRERWMTRKMALQMEKIGVAPQEGVLICLACGEEITADDRYRTEEVLFHERCLGSAEVSDEMSA